MIHEIDMTAYGTGEVINESKDADSGSPTGHLLHSDAISFLNKTDNIKIETNLAFGIAYLVKGIDEAAAEVFAVSSLHPPLLNPDTTELFTEVVEVKVGCIGEINFDYYRVEYDWEAKPGRWLFQVKQGNRILLEKAFNVYD